MASWSGSTYSFTQSLSAVDFYGTGEVEGISASLSGSVTLSVSVTKTTSGSANLSGDVSTASVATRIQPASASLDGSVSLTAIGGRLATISVSFSPSASLTSSTIKEAFAASALSSDVNLTATSLKETFAASATSGSLNLSVTALEILFATADLTGTLVSVVVGREILFTGSSIEITSNVILPGTTKFGPNVVEDVETIRTLIAIDGKPLSEHNRKFASNIIQSFVENRNWASTRSRYYKASSGRKTFSINWTMLPSLRDQTVDKRFGRDKVHEIATDPEVHTLKLLDFDSDGTTPYTETEYNVLVKSYSENLIRRDIGNDMYLWDCSIELEEV